MICKCNGTGWIQYEKDGRPYARYCDCQRERIRNKMIPPKYRGTWDNTGYENDWEMIAEKFIDTDYSELTTLVLYGLTGRGKTRFGYYLMNLWAEKTGTYRGVEFIKTTELERNIYLSKRGGYETTENQGKIEDIRTADFVIFDDFWCSKETTSTDFVKQFNDLFERLAARKIVITMNLNPYDKIDIDTALSRIKEQALILEMKGRDRREEFRFNLLGGKRL